MNTLWIVFFMSILSVNFQDDHLLKKYKWKKRVVLYIVSSDTVPEFVRQNEILKEDTAGIRDRDIVIIPESGKMGVHSKRLYEKYADPNKPFTFLLIGKDGGIKWQTNSVASIQELFQRIDSMPMRQSEIRQKKQ